MPCFAVESLNYGLGNLYIPISFTVLGDNRERISKCVLLSRVFLCSLFEVFIRGSIVQVEKSFL